VTDFPTSNDLFRIARDEVLGRNSSLTREVVEREGTDANALTAASVATADEVVGQLVEVQTGLFLDTAKRSKLDRLVFDRYQLTRKPAAPARGAVQFSTPAAVVVGFVIPAGTRLATTDGKTFVTTAAVTFPGGSSGPVAASVQSTRAGSSQQARKGTITTILDTIAGAPGNMTVTNPLATAGADDEESDADYALRARLFYTTSKRGTLPAIRLGALSTPGVRTADVFETVEPSGVSARLVEVVVADAFTEQLVDTTAVPVLYEAQSQVLAEDVRETLLEYRSAGIQVVVTVGVVNLLGVTLGLRFEAGADITAAVAGAKAAIVSYVNGLGPGESFSRAAAEDALRTVPGLVVLGGEVVSPPGDVVAGTLEVLRTATSLVALGGT
jgi:hypothetical protein